MDKWTEMIIAVILAVIGSSGIWTVVLRLIDRKSSKTKLLVGLAHDRIVTLGEPITRRGYITKDEYENLIIYLGEPYLKCNGNSLAEKIINECKKLPMREE